MQNVAIKYTILLIILIGIFNDAKGQTSGGRHLGTFICSYCSDPSSQTDGETMAFVRGLGSNDNGMLRGGDFFIISNDNGDIGFWVYSTIGFWLVQSTSPGSDSGGGGGGGGYGDGGGGGGGGGGMIPIYGTQIVCVDGECTETPYIIRWIIMNPF